MAQRVVEHAAVGLLSGALVAVVVRAARARIALHWGETILVGGIAAAAFTIADGQTTHFAWSAGVAGVAAVLYVVVAVVLATIVDRARAANSS